MQDTMSQAPATQATPSTLPPVTQRLLHAPQCAASVERSTSQPSPGIMLQSAKPAWQLNPQVPPTQVGVAFGRAGHALSHDPQRVTSLSVWVSQPGPSEDSQLA